MRQKKLITSDQAKFTRIQHTKPCSDCPFRGDAIRGWLGGHTGEWFVTLAQGDGIYRCHTTVGPQCAGLATFRANICKVSRDPIVLRVKQDEVNVFSSAQEFLDHHRLRRRASDEGDV
jgi:hypothetical protein